MCVHFHICISLFFCVYVFIEQNAKPGTCTLWRVSFSYAEKKIMRTADHSIAKRDGIREKT